MFGFHRAVQFKDYYAILDVPKTASQDDIRKAFRKLARLHHPDVAKDKKAAEAKFKEINEANEVLGDPEKRKRYDELGADWNRGPQPGGGASTKGWEEMFGQGGGYDFGGGGGGGGGDFFEMFFGKRGKKKNRSQRGEDHESDVAVTVEEALHGAKKSFTVNRAGRSETVNVSIPKGVREGQQIRLTGQGGAGIGGGGPGDLYLRIRIVGGADYRIDGADLIRQFSLPVATAVLGGEAEVVTPEGTIKLKVPAGTQPGQKFRLKGRGLATAQGTRGDFLAEAKVTLPTALTPEQREVWERIAAEAR